MLTSDLPAEAWAAALASLPGMGPARLLALLRRWPPNEAWARVRAGSWLEDSDVCAAAGRGALALAATWAKSAGLLDAAAMWETHLAAGVGVAALGSPAYPAPLVDDQEPAGVLFFRGDPAAISGPRVAIVGTRAATRYGIDVAHELGRDLAAAGVAVVSGLALGIDGAAHAGALAADTTAPIAVVGSGLDVVYPPDHGALWRKVERCGVILTEAPLGSRPERWRFPARNRLIAALADVVVVVESAERGGSMHTVTEAEARGKTVLAVPGPVRSPASAGTNRLLGEGALPACDASDVLVALGLSPALTRPVADGRPPPGEGDDTVLEAIGWQPVSLDTLTLRTGLTVPQLAVALARLEAQEWVVRHGGWIERVARAEP